MPSSLPKPVWPQLQRGHPLARGLVVGIPFYEGSGGTAHDLSGQANSGSYTGVWAAGIGGSTASTNGSSTQTLIPNKTSMQVQLGDFTVSCRFLMNSVASSYICLFDGVTRDFSLFLNPSDLTKGYFVVSGTTVETQLVLGTTLATGVWFHLVISRLGTPATVYMNGGFASTTNNIGGTRSLGEDLSLGLNPSGGGAAFNGKYDHFYLWNRALSDSEVAQLYQDPFAIYRPRTRQWAFVQSAAATPTQFGWNIEPQFAMRRRPRFNVQPLEEEWPFTAVKTPTQFGWNIEPQFAERKKFQIRDPRLQHEDPNWPFTAVLTPTQFGWNIEPQFAERKKFQPLINRLEHEDPSWRFTAVVTPTQFGWNVEPQFAERKKFQPLINRLEHEDPSWRFTATVTPTQFGWDIPELPAKRRRFQPLQPDEPTDQWPFTAVHTPTQFGWHVDAQFARRHKPQPYQADEPTDQWPFTATPTPGQFGWDNPDQFPKRFRPRRVSQADEDPEWRFTATVTPTQFGWNIEPQFAERKRFQPLHPSQPPEQWPFTAVATPTQMGWEPNVPLFPQRRQHFSLTFHRGEDGEVYVVSAPIGGPAAIFDFPFIANLGRFMGRK